MRNTDLELSQPPIVRDGGIAGGANSDRDPYQLLDELMSVIEVLCPAWPPREHPSDRARFLL